MSKSENKLRRCMSESDKLRGPKRAGKAFCSTSNQLNTSPVLSRSVQNYEYMSLTQCNIQSLHFDQLEVIIVIVALLVTVLLILILNVWLGVSTCILPVLFELPHIGVLSFFDHDGDVS